jgi:hypothetical protein
MKDITIITIFSYVMLLWFISVFCFFLVKLGLVLQPTKGYALFRFGTFISMIGNIRGKKKE